MRGMQCQIECQIVLNLNLLNQNSTNTVEIIILPFSKLSYKCFTTLDIMPNDSILIIIVNVYNNV